MEHLSVWYQQQTVCRLHKQSCDLSDLYDWKKAMTKWLFKYTINFCCTITWSTKSKVFLTSKNTGPTMSGRSIADSYIPHIADRAMWHGCFDLNPDWRLWNTLWFFFFFFFFFFQKKKKKSRQMNINMPFKRFSENRQQRNRPKVVSIRSISILLGDGLLWLFWLF